MIKDLMASDLQISVDFIEKVSSTASHRYKTYKIKKRTSGYRTIDHPARELKLMQRWLVENLFEHLPVHKDVFSYRKGRNIQGNVKRHRTNNYLLRIDFVDFFPSIRATDISHMLQKNRDVIPHKITKRDLSFINSIACKDRCLTIGAPSSPIISNTILFDLDERLSLIAGQSSVSYSRYADDLYFSTNKPNVLKPLVEDVKIEISEFIHPKLRINHGKTVFTSRKRQRKITGVTLTSENKLSIGRQRKRAIKSMVFDFQNKSLSKNKQSYLRGLLAYVQSIEPSFIKALEKKYGTDTLYEIRKSKLPLKKKK